MSAQLADWLPSLPSGWSMKPFYCVFTERKQPNVGLAVDNVLSLSYGRIVERDVESNHGLLPASFEGYNIVEPRDIVMRLTDLQNDQRSLRTGQVEERGVITSAYVTVTPAAEIHPRFAHYLLHGYDLAKLFYRMGGGLRQSMKFDDLKRMPVVLPPPADQERIANFLDEQTARIDALIAEKESLASSLKDIAEVTAYDFVTRGIHRDVARTAHREEWLQEAPAHWGLQKLRQLATIGNGSTPKRDNESYWSGGQIPWLNSGAVNATRITEASDLVTPTALKECHLPMVRAGSTVVALTGQGKTRGAASITEIEATINQHLAYVSLFDARMSDEYLWVFLTGMYSVLRYLSDGEGSTKGALTCEQLNQLRVLVPPPDEQNEIILAYRVRVTAVEDLREHAKTHIDRLREYRSSLISAAVTGQLDLSTFKAAA